MTFPYAPAGLTGAPFFTSTDLANRLQLDTSSINTSTATLLAQLASDAVREDLRLKVDFVANDEITLWGDNGEVLLLPNRPVTDVTSVVLAGQTLIPVVTGTGATGQMFDWRPDGSLRRVVYGGSFYAAELMFKWPLGVPVQITYSHGWTDVPSAMKAVALDLAASVYSNPENWEEQRVGWVMGRTPITGLMLTAEHRSMLDMYRRLDF